MVGVGFGALLAPLTAVWAITYGLRVDWTVFYRAAADGWLLGHGVDLSVAPDAADAARTGLTGAGASYEVTIAALGIGLISLLLARGSGADCGCSSIPPIAAGAAIVVFAILSTLLALTAGAPLVSPSVPQGILLPTGVFVLGLALGAALSGQEISSEQLNRAQSSARDALPFDPRGHAALLVSWSVRLGAASASAVLAVSAVIVAVLLAVNYATIVTLYESVQGGALGGGVLTLAQLLLLPNLVVWAASWLIGPGFAIGAGSSVSPLGTVLGPLPSLPIFGALPAGAPAIGYLGVLVPVAAAFLIGALLRRGMSRDLGTDRPLIGRARHRGGIGPGRRNPARPPGLDRLGLRRAGPPRRGGRGSIPRRRLLGHRDRDRLRRWGLRHRIPSPGLAPDALALRGRRAASMLSGC